MAELSVIVPFVNEWPQIAFTIASIAEELRDRVDFEIIVIDNWCKEVEKQGRSPDQSHKHMRVVEKGWPWLKVLSYDKKLSHWQCKNLGVKNSTGRFLWFCDAHCAVCRDALVKMFEFYKQHHEKLNGTLHLPLTYCILEWHKLIYALVTDLSIGHVHYRFCSYRPAEEPYKVPCMSTCGMMMTRELYDGLGGWPERLGIYGGGENFLNFSMAVLGKNVWIMPGEALRHHGDKRGYHWNSDDHVRNRCVASFIYGGAAHARKMIDNCRGRPRVLDQIYGDVIDQCADHRMLIKNKTVMPIGEWVKKW